MIAVLRAEPELAPQTHTKKEKKYQAKLVQRMQKRLDKNQNSSFDAAFKHVFMQELIRMQDEIDDLKARLDAKEKVDEPLCEN